MHNAQTPMTTAEIREAHRKGKPFKVTVAGKEITHDPKDNTLQRLLLLIEKSK